MKQIRLVMGMPITVEVVDPGVTPAVFEAVFNYLNRVDQRFSTYKKDSEISRINRGLMEDEWSDEMKAVLALCEQTKRATHGYFDIWHNGQRDPSGLVKGWAIEKAAGILRSHNLHNYYVDGGGDIQASGHNAQGQPWQVGVRNPFNPEEVIKVLAINTEGVATSGAYIRGEHIYNPLKPNDKLDEVVSLTVIGPNVYEADRFATAAYAMGSQGVGFIEGLDDCEAYAVDSTGLATMTSGFESYAA